MALIQSLNLPLNSQIIDFALLGTDNITYGPQDFNDKKLLVIVFTCNHCPYAVASWPTLIALQKIYANDGVQFIAINPNDAINYPEDSFENMKIIQKKTGINFPYLYDKTQAVAKAYQAQCTPDIYVFDASRKLKYHGRINDNWQAPQKVTREDLKDAINALLQGSDPSSTEQLPSMGCSIKWK
ncbi:MAG: thioredoxin family protein [Chlamydiota bacterium]|nr:thioredoxin family protein [Chlamydiota bacterium]